MILGTAGHVDHGKTSLVKALTGVDTDRLPEEKRRGITLELGFAHLVLPSGLTLGVVDVPGHERFVKAMAAGAGGVDLALLVVAADEGVMPQTREHLDICGLLGVRAGVVVVTKADLLPTLGDGWLELLTAELRPFVAGTFLENAAMVPVSAKSGQGLDGLLAELERLAATVPSRSHEGPLFLPIDRVFTRKGFGCVVTGTLLSGKLSASDEVAVVPSTGALAGPQRLRSLQVHAHAVDTVQAGARVAVNLASVETADVHRGMALVRQGELKAARLLDVELTLLAAADAPLPRRSRLLLSLGTEQVEAVVQLVDVDALRPGETCFAQVRPAAAVAAMPSQRFILRGTRALVGRGATLAGGRVLGLDGPRRRRGSAAKLVLLAASALDVRLKLLLTEAGYAGLSFAELFARASASARELGRTLEVMQAQGSVVLVDKDARRYLAREVLAALEQRLIAQVDAFHLSAPEREGVPREELRSRLGISEDRVFARVLHSLVTTKRVELEGELVRLPGRGRAFTAAAEAQQVAVLAMLERTGLAPPTPAELVSKLGLTEPRVAELTRVLVARGLAVSAGELTFAASAVSALTARLLAFLEQHQRISTQQFKDLVGQSRKFVIPLAEYFDREKITLRVGEQRVARSAGRAPK